MADLKKFLDQAGVSTLWGQVAAEVAKVQQAADDAKQAAQNNADAIRNHGTRLTDAEGKIAALEAGTYDDSEIRGLIQGNTKAIGDNTAAIAVLNGDAETVGSVANTAVQVAVAEVAKVVADADADFDTLKEIADWILNDTTGAADMANDIAALQGKLAGVDGTVVEEIAAALDSALKVDGVDKYALASDLTTVAEDLNTRLSNLEKITHITYDEVAQIVQGSIDGLKLSETYATKQYADGACTTAINAAKEYADSLAVNYETAGAATQALTEAKAYTDTEVAKIQALTSAEILAAIQGQN